MKKAVLILLVSLFFFIRLLSAQERNQSYKSNLHKDLIPYNEETKETIEIDRVLYEQNKKILIRCFPDKEGKLYIPFSVKKIEKNALDNCAYLTSIYIPDSIKAFDLTKAFSPIVRSPPNEDFPGETREGMSNLSEIIVTPGNPVYSSLDGVLYNKNRTELMYCPRNKTGTVVLPNSVKKIGNEAFNCCNKITSIILNDSVIIENKFCFYSCEQLSSIQVSPLNPYYSSEDGVLYNKNKTEIISYPHNSLKVIHLSDQLKEIKPTYLRYWNHFELLIPNGIEIIRDKAFQQTTVRVKIAYPNSIREIGFSAFIYSNIDTLKLNSIREIKPCAFQNNTNLKSVEITSDSLNIINIRLFEGCSCLNNVTLPKSINKIGFEAFKDCKSLKTFTIASPIPVLLTEEAKVFAGVRLSHCTLRVPKGTRKAYKKAPVWKNFGHIVEEE